MMGAAYFMDQMTESSRSVDSVLSNYPVNMINVGSKTKHQCGHGGVMFLRLGNHFMSAKEMFFGRN